MANSKDKKLSTNVTESPSKTGRTPVNGYLNKTDKYLVETAKKTNTVVFAILLLSIFSIILGILNLLMLKGDITNPADAVLSAEWIECETANHVGYKVRSDWAVEGYGNAVMFSPSATSVISLSAESVLEINSESEVLCTHDTFDEFIEYQLSLTEEAGITMNITSKSPYPIIGQEGIRVEMEQTTEVEGTPVTTYTTSVFWIYDDYLYSLGYTSGVKGYASAEFKYVLESFRIIPEEEWAVLTPDKDGADSLVSDYADFGSSVVEESNSSVESDTSTSSTSSDSGNTSSSDTDDTTTSASSE